MNQTIFKTFILCTICVSILHGDPADLVKTCQNFKTTFLEACQIINADKFTSEMKFLKENLTLMPVGSIIFYEVIIKAIDDCITLLSTQADPHTQELINDLKAFRNQIDSTEMYDLNTGVVVKKEILRSSKSRTKQIPYNAIRCYKVARPAPR